MLNSAGAKIMTLAAIGGLFAVGWLLACFWLSRLPVVSPVSLSLSFRPWWRYWEFGVVLFLFPVVVIIARHLTTRCSGTK